MATFSLVVQGDWHDTPLHFPGVNTVAYLCARVCAMASGQSSEGYGVWISRSIAGVRERWVGNQATLTVSTETLLSGEMQRWRATGSQGGYQADGRTAGSDLVDRKREGSLSEGAVASPLPQHL